MTPGPISQKPWPLSGLRAADLYVMAQDVARVAGCQKQVAAASQRKALALGPHWAGVGCARRRQFHHESWQSRGCIQCCRRPPGLKCVQDMAAEGDPSALFQVARGLMGLQSHFGSFATIKGAGASAAVVGDMLKRMRLELGPDCPPVGDCSLLTAPADTCSLKPSRQPVHQLPGWSGNSMPPWGCQRAGQTLHGSLTKNCPACARRSQGQHVTLSPCGMQGVSAQPAEARGL